MAHARKGTLIYKKSSGWNARIWVDVVGDDGVPHSERRWFPLETHDRELAKRKMTKLVRLLAAGALVAAAKEEASEPETVKEYATSWHAKRAAAGVVMARDEWRNLDAYILPEIGHMALAEVRPVHVRAVLANAVMKELERETVRKIRGVMSRVFDAAWKAELITENPVLKVDVPAEAIQDDRPRTVLSDAQVLRFLNGRASGPEGGKPRKDGEQRLLELKVLATCARVLGGLRTSEVNRWSWDMVDVGDFATMRIRRSKAKRGSSGKVQALIVPEPMRGILRAWWTAHGAPADGPVFPVTKGKTAGAFKAKLSYAKRLRTALLRMGVDDFAIHNDTPSSRKVDFHSFRRAFASGLADAGVNVQTAMHLANHSDSKVHGLYVMQTEAMQRIPSAAIPLLDVASFGSPAGDSTWLSGGDQAAANTAIPEAPASNVRSIGALLSCGPAFEAECRPFESDRAYQNHSGKIPGSPATVTGGDSWAEDDESILEYPGAVGNGGHLGSIEAWS